MHPPETRRRFSLRRLLIAAALVVVVGTLGAVVLAIAAPSRGGILAVTAIGMPYALVPAILAVLVALLAPRRVALVLVSAAVVIALLVVPRVTGLLPHERSAVPENLATGRFVTYNTYIFDRSSPERLLASIAAQAPAVVGLQEVTPERAAAIEADPEISRLFPYRELRAWAPGGGLVLLSSWPLVSEPATEGVSVIEARVDMDAHPVTVLVVHAPLPLALDGGPFAPARRDAMLGVFRDRIGARTAQGEAVILMGDLNTTDRELVFGDIAAGLIDVHAVAGSGPGHTWRIRTQSVATPPLLRIDHMLLSPDLVPVETGIDCDVSPSDHCLLWSEVGWPAPIATGGSTADGPRP